eukprot:2800357-Amphidinium_carterae.1
MMTVQTEHEAHMIFYALVMLTSGASLNKEIRMDLKHFDSYVAVGIPSPKEDHWERCPRRLPSTSAMKKSKGWTS